VLPFIISGNSPYLLGIIDLFLLTLLLIGDCIARKHSRALAPPVEDRRDL